MKRSIGIVLFSGLSVLACGGGVATTATSSSGAGGGSQTTGVGGAGGGTGTSVTSGVGGDPQTAATSGTGSSAGGAAPGELGGSCTAGVDCLSGMCLNLQEFDDACGPVMFCTVACTDASSCPPLDGNVAATDCDNGVCLYQPWLTAAGCK